MDRSKPGRALGPRHLAVSHYVSPGPADPRVEDVNAWPPKVVGWYDGPEVEELPEIAQHDDCVRWNGRLYALAEPDPPFEGTAG